MKLILLTCVLGAFARPQRREEYVNEADEYDGDAYVYYDQYEGGEYYDGPYDDNGYEEGDQYESVVDILEPTPPPRPPPTTTTTTTTTTTRRPPVTSSVITNVYNPEESWYEKRRKEHVRRGQSTNQRQNNRDSSTNQRQNNRDSTANQSGLNTDPYTNQRQPTTTKTTESDVQEYRGPTSKRTTLRSPPRKETAEREPVEEGEDVVDDSECGEECRNKLHYLGHPKEDDKCPEGWVIDIYGYCRQIFHMERRDWDWWENIRHFVHSQGNSWYNKHQPTIHQQMYYNQAG